MHAKLALSIRVLEINEYMAQERTPYWYKPYNSIFVIHYNSGRYVSHLKDNTKYTLQVFNELPSM